MKALEGLKSPARPIQMVDLKSQLEAFRPELREAFDEILDTTAFINGPYVKKFQANLEEYLRAKHVIPCGNGTDALQIAMMGLGLKPGDEVIVPAFTFIASIEVIALLGLTPVVVDVYDTTFNINVEQIEAAISPRTKAILPVHLFGQCARMNAITEVAQKHGLYVIEDNAQSIGARFVRPDGSEAMSGAIGDVGCLSFYPSKNLGAYGDGGAVITNNTELGTAIRSVANHGMSGERYYHDKVGVNSRLDSFQAAVLDIKLQRLDSYVESRISAADHYDTRLGGLSDVSIPARSKCGTHVFHQYTIKVPEGHRDSLKEALGAIGIPCMIYYPVPPQDQEAFSGKLRIPFELTTTNHLCKTVLSLPMHSELETDQLDYICDAIEKYFHG